MDVNETEDFGYTVNMAFAVNTKNVEHHQTNPLNDPSVKSINSDFCDTFKCCIMNCMFTVLQDFSPSLTVLTRPNQTAWSLEMQPKIFHTRT